MKFEHAAMPPSAPFGPHGTLKIVSDGPEYGARGTLKIPSERIESPFEEDDTSVVMEASSETRDEALERMEREFDQKRAEYRTVLANIGAAIASSANQESIIALREQAKKVGTEMAYLESELIKGDVGSTFEGDEWKQEADQMVYEMNKMTDLHGDRFRAGDSPRDFLDEADVLRAHHFGRTMEHLKEHPDVAYEAARQAKMVEAAEELSMPAFTEMDLKKPGEGQKAWRSLLEERGLSAAEIELKVPEFVFDLASRKRVKTYHQLKAVMETEGIEKAIAVYISNPSLYEGFYNKGKKMEAFILEYIKTLTDTDISSATAIYHTLPEGMYELREIENVLYEKAKAMAGSTLGWRGRVKTILKDAPEAMVDVSSNSYMGNTWNSADKLEILKGIFEKGGHLSAAARFGINDIEGGEHAKAVSLLFEAYRKISPDKIIKSAEVFKVEYATLPEDEKTRIKQIFLQDKGKERNMEAGYLVYRLQHIPLSEEEFDRLIELMHWSREQLVTNLEKDNPVALISKANAEHYALEPEKVSALATTLIEQKPFKVLDVVDGLNVTENQLSALKSKMAGIFSGRFLKMKGQITAFFESEDADTTESLRRMRDVGVPLLSISDVVGAPLLAHVLDGELEEGRAQIEAFALLKDMNLPEVLFRDTARRMAKDSNPKSVYESVVQSVQEMTLGDPSVLDMIYRVSPAMTLEILEGSREGRLAFISRYNNALEYAGQLFYKLSPTVLKKIFIYDEARAISFLEILRRITDSPSQEVQRVSEQLADQISLSENPQKAYDQIESVFIRNNLPTVGKIFKVFEILHPKDDLDRKLSKENLSPTLRAQSHRGRMMTMYKDLLHAHIDSSNPSLRQYLKVLQQGEGILAEVDTMGVETLNDEQKKRLRSFLSKLGVLYENSMLGRAHARDARPQADGDMKEEYTAWCQSLGVKKGQSAVQRIADMFFKPLGYGSLEEVLNRMDDAKREAHERNVALSTMEHLELKEGDLLKGIDDMYFRNIMQNGSVAKEFLGASSNSDYTPLDTDVGRVSDEDGAKSFQEALEASPAIGYGEVVFIIKNRGQFQETFAKSDSESLRKTAHERKSSLELFYTGADGERAHGIRTGFPMTEVSGVVVSTGIEGNAPRLDSMCMDIVQNGFYMSVVDRDGKILFTPEVYYKFQERYNVGLERFGGKPFTMEKTEKTDIAIETIKLAQREERDVVSRTTEKINERIFEILSELGIETYAGESDVAVKPELIDTGSSGRGTNILGVYDFDFVLKLNPKDIAKVASIRERIMQTFGAEDNGSYDGQLRLKGGKLVGLSQELEIDIAFVSKSELAVYESHDALKERFDGMDPVVREEVVANIVLAKKILKEAGAYKKPEGGFGGVGVENFIIQNGGNVISAFKRFNEVAYKSGTLISFNDFKKEFKIIDPGLNAKFDLHDNFVSIMKKDGYERMAKAVHDYLAKM